MHDLNTISRLNAESVTASTIRAARAAGHFALAKYEGLHLVDHIASGDKGRIERAAADLNASATAGARYEVMAPAL